jgi:hypothetical protein
MRLEAWPEGYNGWYSAQCIERHADGTYHVLFDDQEEITSLDPSRVRPPTKLVVGTQAAVLYRSEWVSCVISAVEGIDDQQRVTATFSNGERQVDLARSDLMFPPTTPDPQFEGKTDEKEEKVDALDPDVAATKVQALWRGVQVKKDFSNKRRHMVAEVPKADAVPISPNDPDFADVLADGEVVSVNYHDSGNYYSGRITRASRAPDGKVEYEVLYDDGDMEAGVPRKRIVQRTVAPSQAAADGGQKAGAGALHRFDAVSVDYHGSGNFYRGQITQVVVHEETGETVYDVVYDDGDAEAAVPRGRIVPLVQQQQQQPQASRQRKPDRSSSSSSNAARQSESTPRSSSVNAPLTFRSKQIQSDGTSLSEARRLMRSAKALDLMVEWVSCWAGGGGGSAAEATMGLRALTHPDVVFSVPARAVHCASISELLDFRKSVQHRLGERRSGVTSGNERAGCR